MDTNNSKTLYHIVCDQTGARNNSNAPFKDENIKILLRKEGQNAQWVKQFKEMLNQPAPVATYNFSTAAPPDDLAANVDAITPAGTSKALQTLKSNKA